MHHPLFFYGRGCVAKNWFPPSEYQIEGGFFVAVESVAAAAAAAAAAAGERSGNDSTRM